jgi:muramoyltetrapeptide carboxypeptidase LdcA involved in peptidoglycan recycling
MIKPRKLVRGSRIAAVSLSWGGPGTFPYRYEIGKRQFEAEFGVSVVETRHALRDADWLHRNPEARAEDLLTAFSDLDTIRNNPKVFIGFSDTSITHAVCHRAGLVSFYGPAIMAGFGENTGIFPYMVESVRRTLFSSAPIGILEPNRSGWTSEHLDWGNADYQNRKRKLVPCTGWNFHQEAGTAEGRLFGGCTEVLDWMRGTRYWPTNAELKGAVLFLETSEEVPPPSFLIRFIRSLAAMGQLEGLAGILLGRPGGQIPEAKFAAYDNAIVNTVRTEFGLINLPIVTNMDFGHTDPMFVLPLGVKIRIDSALRQLTLPEAAVAD